MTTQQKQRSTINITLEDTEDLKLSLEETGMDAAVIVRISGFIDTFNSDFFRKQVNRVIEAGYNQIIFDTTATTFMSSTGIGAFTALLQTIKQKQGSLIIFGMPPRIFEVFQLLGFTSFFQFSASRNEALGMLRNPSVSLSVFPVVFSCPVCHRKLKAGKSGRFRCSSCRVILAVNPEGDVHLG